MTYDLSRRVLQDPSNTDGSRTIMSTRIPSIREGQPVSSGGRYTCPAERSSCGILGSSFPLEAPVARTEAARSSTNRTAEVGGIRFGRIDPYHRFHARVEIMV